VKRPFVPILIHGTRGDERSDGNGREGVSHRADNNYKEETMTPEEMKGKAEQLFMKRFH
jgi:hypothetical protein